MDVEKIDAVAALERDKADRPLKQLSNPTVAAMGQSYAELVALYGEDNAQYLYETLCQNTAHYTQLTYIEMGLEPDDRFERQARATAQDTSALAAQTHESTGVSL